MLIVHTFPSKDPLTLYKSTIKTDNYFRVSAKVGGESHVFPFSSGNHQEASWAFTESRRIFDELGGPAKAVLTVWEKHPDFEVVDVVGEGARIDDLCARRSTRTATQAN